MMRKFGRRPRIFDPRVPHLSAYRARLRASAPAIPAALNNLAGLPTDLGAMLNNQLGDCTCAAIYHAIQVWTQVALGRELTYPDSDVLAMYEQACGYNPANPATDQGGVEQSVLTSWASQGAPPGDRLAAFFEIDPANHDDVRRAIAECGVSYLGLTIPAYLFPAGTNNPPQIWDVDSAGNNTPLGGHAVICAGYDAAGLNLVSWGEKYRMTWAFWDAQVDETYALISPDWIAHTGFTPFGMTEADLMNAMGAIREAV